MAKRLILSPYLKQLLEEIQAYELEKKRLENDPSSSVGEVDLDTIDTEQGSIQQQPKNENTEA
jgi:hypothetical protein